MDFLADANVARPDTFAGYAALAPDDLASLTEGALVGLLRGLLDALMP